MKKSINSSIFGNIIYQSIYQIMAILMPLVVAPYISRTLGAEKIGEFSYITAIANYFVIFTMLGINNYGSRKISQLRNDNKAMLDNFFGILKFHIILSIFMVILYYLFIYFFLDNTFTQIAIAASFFIISSIFDIQWFFAGNENFKVTAGLSTISKLLTGILIFVFVKKPSDVLYYTLIMAFSHFFTNILPWYFLLKRFSIKFIFKNISVGSIKKHIIPCFVFFIPVIAITVYRTIGKVFLGNFSTMEQAGLYENADRVTQIVLGIIGGIGYVMQQRMSNLYSKKEDSSAEFYLYISFLLTGLVACALSFGLSAVSEVLAPVYFGEQFRESGLIISILALEILYVSFANVVRTNYLIPTEKDRQYVFSVSVGCFINLICNFLLIPSFGGLGAAISVMVTDFGVFLIQSYVVKNEIDIKFYLKIYLDFILIGSIMWLSVRSVGIYLGENIISLITQIVIGCFVYTILSFYYLKYKHSKVYKSIINKMNII